MSSSVSVDFHTVRPANPYPRRPLVSYSFRRYKHPSYASDDDADEERQFRFNQQLAECVDDRDWYYKVVETNWGPVTTFVYDGTKLSELLDEKLHAPREDLRGMLENMRCVSSRVVHSGESDNHARDSAGIDHEIRRRHLFYFVPPVGKVTVSHTPWASVRVYPKKDTCSPFCPHESDDYATGDSIPTETHLCTHRDTSVYPWIPLIEEHMCDRFHLQEERESFTATQ